MKKINRNLVIAIIWILVASYFFYINKIGVGLCWLLVGIINLNCVIKRHHVNKKTQEVIKHLEETVNFDLDEEETALHKAVIETIKLSKENHIICDNSSGYEYVINKTFKLVKSHAAEVELLCTYAPDDEYGKEGTVPYVAVQIDDMVYCAVEEYKESMTFEGAISIEPLEGKFMFKAKRDYYGDMMYFYGFEVENDGYIDKAGLCLVYPKEYVGSEDEKKLMQTLDEVARSFNKIIEKNALAYLNKEIENKNGLDELILTFEKMCEIPIVEEEEIEILFETGTYSLAGEPMFNFSLVRQYPNEEEEYCQIHLDIMFKPTDEISSFKQTTWNFELEESIFDYIRKSAEYKALKDKLIVKIDVYMDET